MHWLDIVSIVFALSSLYLSLRSLYFSGQARKHCRDAQRAAAGTRGQCAGCGALTSTIFDGGWICSACFDLGAAQGKHGVPLDETAVQVAYGCTSRLVPVPTLPKGGE